MRYSLAVLAWAALMLSPSPSVAAPLSGVTVEGLRLGMTRSTVQERYPYMHFEEIPYFDERVEDRYAVLYGSLVAERIEGRAIEEKVGRLLVVEATLGADDRLIAVSVFAEHETLDCRQLAEQMRTTYDRPTIDNGPAELAWIEKALGVNRALRFTCYDRKSYALKLIDHQARVENLRAIRKKLEPYVLETLQRVQ